MDEFGTVRIYDDGRREVYLPVGMTPEQWQRQFDESWDNYFRERGPKSAQMHGEEFVARFSGMAGEWVSISRGG